MKNEFLQLKRALRNVLLVLLLNAVGMGKMDAQSFTVGDLRYTVNSDGISVTVNGLAQGISASGELVIPEIVTYNGSSYSVTTIGNDAFNYCSGFTGTLTIPNSVTVIGELAFYNCDGFTGSLAIGNSVTTIGESAFWNCSGFTGDLVIPNSVTMLGEGAFGYCSGFTGSLAIGNSVTTIGEDTFSNCSGFSGNLVIPNSVTEIGGVAFYGCTGFTGDLVIPNSVTKIGGGAFGGCSGFTGSLTFGNSLTTIGESAFYNCSGFTGDLVIPDSVTTIGEGAFGNCSGFTGNLTIGNSVTTIGHQSFLGCSGFTGNLTIGNSVTTIGYGAFYDCSGFTGDLVIPDSVTSIGASAFSNCSGFTGSLTIGNSVTAIDYYAFQNCSFDGLYINMTNVIENFNGRIGATFSGSLTIGNSVTTIGNNAFNNCSGFTGNLTIGNSVTTIGNSAFYGCNGLTAVHYIGDVGQWCNISFSSYLSNPLCYAHYLYIDNELVTDLVIPETVTEIKNYAFYGCSGFTGSLTIPNSVTTIGEYAFYGCSGFTGNLTIPNSVTSIGGGAFCGCSGFTGDLVIPNSVTEIGDWAFSDCSGFTGNLTIPNTVTSIGGGAFYGCYGFTGSLAIGNSVTEIGAEAFFWCESFTVLMAFPETPPVLGSDAFMYVDKSIPVYVPYGTVEAYQTAEGWNEFTNYIELEPIEENITFDDPKVKAICVANWDTNGDGELSFDEAAVVTDLGQVFTNNRDITSFDELQYFTGLTSIGSIAFTNCSGLVSIEIPVSVISINQSAFSNCSGLTSIEIPQNVNSINQWAFNNCSSLNQIIVNQENLFFDSREGCNAIINTSTNTLVVGCNNTVIPNSVTSIGDYAFYSRTELASIEIPNSVTSIGYGTFCYCSSLAFIDIPNSVVSIGIRAFESCTGLTSVSLSTSVTSIKGETFLYCSGLISIEIPNSVTSIESNAFYGCSGLTSVSLGNSLTSIGSYAFGDCINLTSMNIPNSVHSIGRGVFRSCNKLGQIIVESGNIVYDSRENCNAIIHTSTNELVVGCKNSIIPNTVSSIGEDAFRFCYNLTSIEIPNSVTNIGNYAFSYCSGLMEISVLRTNPSTLGNNAFSYTNCPIYVPYESLNVYKTAANWSSYEDRIFPMTYTTIQGYGEGEGNYRFIASPLVENTDPATVDNMITETAYDLYRFDQSENAEWQNYKTNTENFVLENGQGYLYANVEEVNIIFKGEFNEDETKEVGLVYDANAEFAGWNLVGNPFPVSAYTNRSYYTMNGDGTAVEPNALSSGSAIPACTGIMVMAEAEGETVVFSTEAPDTVPDKGCLQIALSQVVEPVETPTRKQDGPSTLRQAQGSGTLLDKAIVSFNANDRLEKFVFNMDNARISIPQSGKELAIACSDKRGEMPLNFKATKNGQYIISVSYDDVEMDYLHLIDNLTGNDIDLLATSNYTFEAKTTDYASRFRLVFSANETDGPSTGSVIFAYVNKGNIIINGEGALQIVDVTGRVVRCTDVARNVSTNGMVPGVYVLRLINGNDVKTQKIVIE